jgi:DNA-binding CsgD family transcriptional regulator
MVDQLLRIGDPGARAPALLLQASIALWSEANADAAQVLRNAFEELSPTQPDAAAVIGIQLATLLAGLGKLHEATVVSSQVRGLPFSDPTLRLAAQCDFARASLLVGDRQPFDEFSGEMSPAELQELVAGPGTEMLYPLAQTWVFVEQFGLARRMLEAQVGFGRLKSAASALPWPMFILADLEWRVGNFADAKVYADEALALAEVTGVERLNAFGHAGRARVSAIEGDEQGCRVHARIATELAATLGQRPVEGYVNHALGLFELGRGHWTEAAEHLERNLELEAWTGLGSPAVVPWKADYVEALAQAGQSRQAWRVLEDLERQAHAVGCTSAMAAARRCRTLLGEDLADDLGEAAIAASEGFPIEQARAHLILGERLRRERRVAEARGHLRTAVQTFVRCGASPWAARAERELVAAGGRPRHGPALGQSLTHQELQISRLATEGATNKEIAAALFISQKTVEYHLQKVFSKLGAPNRTQAARLLAARDA